MLQAEAAANAVRAAADVELVRLPLAVRRMTVAELQERFCGVWSGLGIF